MQSTADQEDQEKNLSSNSSSKASLISMEESSEKILINRNKQAKHYSAKSSKENEIGSLVENIDNDGKITRPQPKK